MSTPIYLIKAELDDGLLGFLLSYVSPRPSETDTAHWALEINGQQYQLGKKFFKQLKLNVSDPIPLSRIMYRKRVGETLLEDKEIGKAGQEVIDWMKFNYGWYDAFAMNCQAFVNHLWHRIRTRNGLEPYHDLLGLPMGTCAGIDYRASCTAAKRDSLKLENFGAFIGGALNAFLQGTQSRFLGFFKRAIALALAYVALAKTFPLLLATLGRDLRLLPQ